jgi:nicotinate-nucleotide adenylyltransferase
MRIGILGGTFNPIHNAHLDIARAALDQLRLDRIIFIPARTPPHKRTDLTLAPPEHRLRMVELAVANIPGAEVSDIELQREGPSYTYDTVTALKERFGPETEFFFILGSDQVLELPTWRRVTDLVRICRFIPIERPGFPLAALDSLVGRLPDDVIHSLQTTRLKLPPSTTSATEIRRRLAAGEDVSALLPKPVIDYIGKHHLYRNPI